jgi:hypothetical protein
MTAPDPFIAAWAELARSALERRRTFTAAIAEAGAAPPAWLTAELENELTSAAHLDTTSGGDHELDAVAWLADWLDFWHEEETAA